MSSLGFEWSERKGRKASGSGTGLTLFSTGDCGVGDGSRDVFLVPVPDAEVAVDMYEKRERPRN